MAGAPPDPVPELPAALLEPAFECWGAPTSSCPQDLGQVFDVNTDAGFTICARVRVWSSLPPGGLRIFQKGEPPNGWMFSAPNTDGFLAFQAGALKKEEAPALLTEEPAADGSKRPSVAEEDGGSKRGSVAEPPAETVEPSEPTIDLGPFVSSTKVDDGAWHHVAVTWRGGRIVAYVDGRPDGQTGIEVAAAPSAALLLGPELADGAAEGLKDVQVFSTALSDAQLLGLATESRELPTGLSLPFTHREVRDFWRLHGGSEGTPGDVSAARALAAGCLGLGQAPSREFQDEVICDFFVNLLEHAQSLCLTSRKSAVFIAIMQFVFNSMFRRSKTTACVGESFSSSECYLEYKRLMLDHAATAAGALSSVPPKRLQIFSVGEVKLLTEFVAGTLFQHFFLYQCVLVSPQDADVRYTSVTLECPRAPPPLRKAKLRHDGGRLAKKKNADSQRGSPAGDADAKSTASVVEDGAAEGGADANATEGGEGVAEQAADATQMPGSLAAATGASKEDEDLDFLVSEASKAAEQAIEASIQTRDEALKNR